MVPPSPLASYLHVHGVELGGDGGGVARLQAGEEDGLGRLGDGAGDIEEEGGEHGGDAGHDAETRRTNRFEKFRHSMSSWRDAPGKSRPSLLGKHCRAVW